MSGSVSYSCVRNCHRTFAIPQNLSTLVSQGSVWYEEGISKLVSWYDKCLSVQGDYVEKYVKVCDKTCMFCFFPFINKYLRMTKRSLLSVRPTYYNLFYRPALYGYNDGLLPLLRKHLLIPNRTNKFTDLRAECSTSCFNQFCWNLINNR